MVNRGEVWEYIVGSRQYRVLVISNDEFNEEAMVRPWGLPIDRAHTAVPSGLMIRLGEDDPLSGATVYVADVLRLDRSALRRSLGYLSHPSMEAVESALRDFLALP